MRKITHKRYYGFADRTVPHLNGNGVQVVLDKDKKPLIEYDRSWVHVREGYEIVTYHVPSKFDIVYRYLRLHGLAKYVHDYPSLVQGWGWRLEVGDSLMLTFHNPSPALNEPTSTLVASFRTRQERRHAIKMVVVFLTAWRDAKFGDPNVDAILLTHAKNLLVLQQTHRASEPTRQWEDLDRDEQKALIQTAKIFHGHSIKHRAKL